MSRDFKLPIRKMSGPFQPDYLTKAGDWDESKHPRDEGGKFSSGGGGSQSDKPPSKTLSKPEKSKVADFVAGHDFERGPVDPQSLANSGMSYTQLNYMTSLLGRGVRQDQADIQAREEDGDDVGALENHIANLRESLDVVNVFMLDMKERRGKK